MKNVRKGYAGGGAVSGGLSMLRKALTGQMARDAGTTSVIKEKGGNWLAGSVERPLSELLRHADDPRLREALIQIGSMPAIVDAGMEQALTMDNWIKGPLTTYVKRDLATPNDPVRLRAERIAEQATKQKAQGDAQLAKMKVKEALRSAGDTRGADYMLRDMRLRADALRTVHDTTMNKALHIIPDTKTLEDIGETYGAYGARTGQTFPAKSGIGKFWDSMADGTVDNAQVKSYSGDQKTIYKPGNEWMQKAASDTPVYSMNVGGSDPTYDLGLDHLTDELYNALNAHSEHARFRAAPFPDRDLQPSLPEHLAISPEQLEKMGMEQAVDHVSKINEHRANLKREADVKFGVDHPAYQQLI